MKIPPHITEVQRPQRKRKRHFIGTWPEVMLSAGMEGEVNVTLSGRNIAVSTRMMASEKITEVK